MLGDIKSLAKVLSPEVMAHVAKGDLSSAAKAMGMEQEVIPPCDVTNADAIVKRQSLLETKFVSLAEAAQIPSTEVIALSGSPAVLKGKKVTIIAVLQNVQKSS